MVIYVGVMRILLCLSATMFAYKRCSVRLYLKLVVGVLMSYLVFGICVCLRAWCSTRLDCMSNMADVIYKRQELLTVHEHLDTSPVIGGVLVAHHFSFLWVFFFFVLCDMFRMLPISLE